VVATVKFVIDTDEWWYTACVCNKKVLSDEKMYFCAKCNKHVMHVPPRCVTWFLILFDDVYLGRDNIVHVRIFILFCFVCVGTWLKFTTDMIDGMGLNHIDYSNIKTLGCFCLHIIIVIICIIFFLYLM